MSIKVICSEQEEYKNMLEIKKELDNKDIYIDVMAPEDCMAHNWWSIKDLVDYFPENTPKEHLETALEEISSTIEGNMVTAGYETMSELSDSMYDAVLEEFGIDYRNIKKEYEEENEND